MRKITSIFLGVATVTSSLISGVFASDLLPEHVDSCLKEAAAIRSPRYGGVTRIEVYSKYEVDNQTYLQAYVTTPKKFDTTVHNIGWSIVVKYDASLCSFIGDDYVAEYAQFQGIDESIVKAWTIQDYAQRLQEVNKSELKAQIKDPFFKWHSGQIAAFEELGLW